MIVLDLSILNQKGTPMFNSDTFANRPTFGIVGRIFISTDTKEFFRDTGTSWELIGGPGSGTITGSGAAGQVTYFTGASSVAGSNNLFWDAANNHLGINTNTPGTSLDIHHNQSTILQLNQTTATNDTRIAFQNSGTALWRIGNFYTAGANDFGVFDVVNTTQQLTIVKSTGQTFIGAKTTASGRLVVNSATADNHLQIVGANAPSIRIDNAGSGGTQRFVFGLATATNNFIQGAAAGEFCISTQSAGNMLFGMWQTTNASEVMRITTANNLLIGTSVDGGQRVQVSGGARATGYYVDGMVAGSGALYWGSVENRVTLANYNVGGILNFEVNGGVSVARIDAMGNFGLGVVPSSWGSTAFKVLQIGSTTSLYYDGGTILSENLFINSSFQYIYNTTNFSSRYDQTSGQHRWFIAPSGTAGNAISFTQAMTLTNSGNLLVGTSVDGGEKFQTSGTAFISGITNIGVGGGTHQLTVNVSSGADREMYICGVVGVSNGFRVRYDNASTTVRVSMSNLPTSPVGLVTGDLWNNLGILNIV
jgi:hypothetical protein